MAMSLSKFESMLKTNAVYFFDLVEFEEIIIHYLESGKHNLAKKAVQLGLEQHPESIDLKFLQVELYLFNNELENASKLLKKIELLNPNNDELFIQKATIESKQGNHEQAIQYLHKALNFTDDKLDIWSLIGMEYLYLDDFDNARLNFAKCIDVDYEDYSALYNIVYCFDMQNEHEQAVVYLNNYINRNPYSEVAWHQLGRQYFVLNNFKDALRAFDYAVLIDEHFIGGYLEKAKTLEELKEYDKAIENYLITLELDDPTAFAYVRIGECYEQLNKFDDAIVNYKKAVYEDPLLDRGWVLLTNLYHRQKKYKKAAHYIAKALKIDENNSLYWRKYANIKTKLFLYEDAVVGYKKCLELNDNSLDIYIALSDCLSLLHRYNDAITILFKTQKYYKDFAEVEYRLAGLFYLSGKNKYGYTHLISALKIDYDYHSILNELFPLVYDDVNVQTLIIDYKKALE